MMNSMSDVLKKVFGVVVRGQTYLNLIYLLLAFPLGVFYFVYLVVGLSVGVATLILWIGLAILVLVIAGWYLMAAFERILAINLLRVPIPPMASTKMNSEQSAWKKFTAFLSNPVTWKSLVYLLVKFPLGIIIFVLLVTLIAITGLFLTAPLTYNFYHPEIWFSANTFWRVDTLSDSLIAFAIGLPLFFASLHIFNGLAWVSGQFARVMLGNYQSTEKSPEIPAVNQVVPTVSVPEPIQNESPQVMDGELTPETEEK